MGHMAIGILVDTCWIELTQCEMEGFWTLRIGGVMSTCTILVLVQLHIMIIMVVVLVHKFSNPPVLRRSGHYLQTMVTGRKDGS